MTEEEVGEEQYVAATLVECRHLQRELVQTVVQILAECAFGYCSLKVFVGGGDKTHVDIDFLGGAYRTHLALLKRTQQLHLHLVA